MTGQNRRIVIIGGGIAGLCVASYARKCGYEVELLEQHDNPGNQLETGRLHLRDPPALAAWLQSCWLMTPDMGFKSLPLTLPGLRQFLQAGQWCNPAAAFRPA